MASKPIVLMIWIHDVPITASTISMSSITEPRKAFSEYSVGEKVKVRLNRFGIVEGAIGKIGDDNQKRQFNEFINSRCFDQLVSGLGCCGEDRTKQPEDQTSTKDNTKQQDEQEGQKPTARKSDKNKGDDSDLNASSGKKMKGICSDVFNNYTKDQLRSFVKGAATYVKAAKSLFKKLYTKEEMTGRTLTGNAANKSTTTRPALQDQHKLEVIYELVQEKYPWCNRSMINRKLAELLKPSALK